ncbi:MAG: helix-turn-helix domain-containing protein [Deltaproteobacteria bacterium]|nr:helix-turn-helix domain-containing protein [Deltaproteobacteria bacterium]
MNTSVLKVISKLRHLSRSDLAKMAHVSKQAVSLWFQKEETTISVQSKHLQALALALHLKVDDLLTPLPLSKDTPQKTSLTTSLLWDHLYPSLEDFVIALVRHKPRALSRLVEVYGLFQSKNMLGKSIWTLFPKYKKYLPPIRRKQSEQLWHFMQNQILN